jgi:hypothetical protein
VTNPYYTYCSEQGCGRLLRRGQKCREHRIAEQDQLAPPKDWGRAIQVVCPHVRNDKQCMGVLLGRIWVPPSTELYAVAIRHTNGYSGRGFVKQCSQCHGYVEILNQRAVA